MAARESPGPSPVHRYRGRPDDRHARLAHEAGLLVANPGHVRERAMRLQQAELAVMHQRHLAHPRLLAADPVQCRRLVLGEDDTILLGEVTGVAQQSVGCRAAAEHADVAAYQSIGTIAPQLAAKQLLTAL